METEKERETHTQRQMEMSGIKGERETLLSEPNAVCSQAHSLFQTHNFVTAHLLCDFEFISVISKAASGARSNTKHSFCVLPPV